VTKRVDLVVETTRHPAHRRALDPLVEQCLGDAGHVTRRQAADVRLRDGVVDFRTPARVAAERRGRGAAVAGASDPQLHLAGGRDHPTTIPAVPDVDALVTVLVPTGTNQPLQFLVEDDLDGRPHRVTAACGEVQLEVGLRRNHEVGSFSSEGSFWSLHGRVS
jgi:hypothetical protein